MTRALVTGAGRRLGRTFAVALGARGHHVLVHYHGSADGAAETVQIIRASGGRADAVACDLSDPAGVDRLVPGLCEQYGAIDVLVNSASVFLNDSLDRLDNNIFDRQVQVNLKAPAFLSRAFAAQAPDGSVIINILDNKVAAPDPGFLSYGLTKIALEGLVKMLAVGLAPRIRVNGLAPGLTLISGNQTPESFARAKARTPLGRSAEPDDLAQALIYLTEATHVTGQILVVDGGRWLDGPMAHDAYYPAHP